MGWPKRTITRLEIGRDSMVPIVEELYRYWSAGARDHPPGPAWGEGFKLVEVASDVLPNMVVVDVGLGIDDFTYRFWGSERGVYMRQGDPTGKRLQDGLSPAVMEMVVSQYRDVVTTGVPLLMLHNYQLKSGLIAECQTIRLPLSPDGERIDKVVSVTQFLRHKQEYQEAEPNFGDSDD